MATLFNDPTSIWTRAIFGMSAGTNAVPAK